MTGGLGPTARALLAAAREELGPDPGAAARVRARVALAVGGAAGAAPAAAGAAPAAGGPPVAAHGLVARWSLVKLAGLALVAGGAGGVAWRVAQPGDRPSTSRAAAQAPAPHAAPARALSPRATPAASAPRATPAGPPAMPAAGPGLAREVELIDRANLALREGHLRRAIEAIGVFDRETAGHGQLGEDAAAIDIEARCRLHERGVAARLAAFDARWPASAQRPRLTAACGPSSEP